MDSRNLTLILTMVMVLFPIAAATAKTEVVKVGSLPEYIKSEVPDKVESVLVFTAKSGKYKIAAMTREKGKGKFESRMVAFELLKSVKLPSVIRSTKWQTGYDFQFTEVESWQFAGNPVLIVESKLRDNRHRSEFYVFDGPEMKQVNILTGEKISLKDKNKDQVTLSFDSQKYKWNGEKLVKF